ncbi:MAG: CHAT domain-containing protein [Cyanobacteria bacterium J06560_6]
MPSVQRILILASNPLNSNRLRLDKEVREIEDALNQADKRDFFDVKPQLATRPKDIQQALLRYQPQFVHFCGHGEGKEGLVFEDDTGHSQLVSSEALANLFELFSDTVKCVVLNACYSEVQAKAISTQIDTVIGMSRAIEDRAAIAFSGGFYRGLGAGKSVEFAYKLGRNSLQLQSIPKAHAPILINKYMPFTNLVSSDVLNETSHSQLNQHAESDRASEKSNIASNNTAFLEDSSPKNGKTTENKKKGIRSWKCVQTLSQESGDSIVLFTPDSKFIIIGNQKSIEILNSTTRKVEHEIRDIEGKISALAISPDSQYLMSGGYDRTISIWDVGSKKLIRRIPSRQNDTKRLGNITSIVCSSDCRYIYTGDTKGVARAWNFDNGECIFNIQCHSTALGAIALNSTWNWLATCGDDKKVKLIDLDINKLLKKGLRDSERIQSILFSSDENFLIYAGDSGNICLYDVRDWRDSKLSNHGLAIKSMVISPNNNYCFCAGLNKKSGHGSIKIWKLNPSSKRALRSLKGHRGAVYSLAIAANGNILVSGSNDRTVKIWEGDFEESFGSTQTTTVSQLIEASEFPKALNGKLENYIAYLEEILLQKKRFTLKSDHKAIIYGAYYRKSYAQIAAEYGFAETYLRRVSKTLWTLLTDVLRVKVDKQRIRRLVQTFTDSRS